MVISNTKEKGIIGEQQACEYLIKQGLTLIEKNYYCRYGEIDLIMKDKNELVFVEVRSRNPTNHGSAVETINHKKIDCLRKTAEHYLQQRAINTEAFCRFDVVAIDNKAKRFMIDWLQNAF